jgi:hypothetical protein
VGIAGKAVLGAIQQHKANQIKPDYHPYTPSPYAQQTYGLAQQVYNGRMAGAPSLERNIMANQANQQANVARTATDGSQALAVQAGQQGQTNQAFSNLQTQEANNKYQLLNNLNLASAGMTAEGDKQYQSELQKYQMDTSQQTQLRQAGLANMFGALGDVGKVGIMAGQGYFKGNGPGVQPGFDPTNPATWTKEQIAAYQQNGGNWNG